MTAPIRPDPPKFVAGKEGLSTAWLKYLATPFVTDTLSLLVGKEPVTLESRYKPPMGQENLRGGLTASGTMKLYEGPNDDLFTHELGHVIEWRLLAPEVTDSLRTMFETKAPRAWTYKSATGDPAAEYIAETFRMAVDMVRKPDEEAKNLEKTEKKFPGVSMWTKWLHSRLDNTDVASQP